MQKQGGTKEKPEKGQRREGKSMKKLMALTTALFLATLVLWGGLAKADDQPRPPMIQLLQGQESPMQPQPGEQDQPQGEEEQPQQEQPAPEQLPQGVQQQ